MSKAKYAKIYDYHIYQNQRHNSFCFLLPFNCHLYNAFQQDFHMKKSNYWQVLFYASHIPEKVAQIKQKIPFKMVYFLGLGD
jgi:hypothetical protein